MIQSLALIQINVLDLQQAHHFYCDVLGLKHSHDSSSKGVIQLELDGAPPILLYPVQEMVDHRYPMGTGRILVFRVTNIDQAVQELGAQGVQFIRVPWSNSENGVGDCPYGRFIGLKDPFGNVHELLEPLTKDS